MGLSLCLVWSMVDEGECSVLQATLCGSSMACVSFESA